MELNTIEISIAALAIIFIALYIYFQRCYQYWSKRNVQVLSSAMFPFGNARLTVFGKKTLPQIFNNSYKEIKGSYGGLYVFTQPCLIIKDPECIKNILVKDFNNFQDRMLQRKVDKNTIADHLFFMTEGWRSTRNKLSPTFTSGKLKNMFQFLVDCGTELENVLQVPADSNQEIQIKEYFARFTTDIIASVAFGIDCNCLKNPDAEFRIYGKKSFQYTFIRSVIGTLQRYVSFLDYFDVFPNDVTSFFEKVLAETIDYREKNRVSRNDFLQMLIQLKNVGRVSSEEVFSDLSEYNTKNKGIFSFEEIVAQSFLFFVAGFETSSSTMTLCMYELSLHKDIQAKVQKEIDEVLSKNGDKITYDSISEMKYLDNVIAETLRKYPILPILNRVCTNTYKLPDSELVIEKGVNVIIPVQAIQNDPEIFPNPDNFDPDRFLPENKTFNPYCYLPFGEGPRNCIGARLGKMQVKIGLVSFLRKYNIDTCSKTDIPLRFNSRGAIVIGLESELILKISNRK